MTSTVSKVFAWLARNERHLGAVLFVFGFITDLFTFALLSITLVNLAFIGYLTLAALCTFGSHSFANAREDTAFWRRALSILFPLGAQYAIGSLLSGCLIFYTKSASLIVSWPFLVLLAVIFLGNEYFRTYYKHLAFQAVLLFFSIYAYAIFALPLVVHQLGALVFLGSSAIALIVFALLIFLLSRIDRERFLPSLRYIIPGTLAIVVIMNVFYFTELIPPIPLTLPEAGIYHSVVRRDNGYALMAEAKRAWWQLTPVVIHHVAGTPLYAFSSVSAPISFSTSVMHVWERLDPETKKWVVNDQVIFPIAGGRGAGYRGYSEASNPLPGRWRVSIETPRGQVIGRVYFEIEDVASEPVLHEETH